MWLHTYFAGNVIHFAVAMAASRKGEGAEGRGGEGRVRVRV